MRLYASFPYFFVEIPKTKKAKTKSKEPLEHGVTVIRVQTGVEAKAGLCLISRAPSAGVQPDPTGLCIWNQPDLLYLQGEPFHGADCDQTGMSVKTLNSDDLAAQDQTARSSPYCMSRYFRSAPRAHFTVNIQITFYTENK